MNFAIFCLIFIYSFVSAAAPSADESYQAKIDRVSKSQSLSDQLIKSLGITQPTHFDQTPKDETRHSIIQIHSDMKSSRLKSGQLLYGKLLNRLVVGPDGSPAILILDEDQGTLSRMRLIGQARQAGTAGRLAIEFSRITLSNGKAIVISALALDEAGAYGLQAQVFSSKALMIAGAMAGSFIAGVAASQQSQTTNAFGFQQTPPTGRNAVLQGVAQTAADQSKRLIEDATSEKPILVLEPESKVTAFVQEEVKF